MNIENIIFSMNCVLSHVVDTTESSAANLRIHLNDFRGKSNPMQKIAESFTLKSWVIHHKKNISSSRKGKLLPLGDFLWRIICQATLSAAENDHLNFSGDDRLIYKTSFKSLYDNFRVKKVADCFCFHAWWHVSWMS